MPEGHEGAVREWLGRAARAPRDKAWVADGVISDRWAPVSPSGTLDAFVWRTPDERIAAPVEPPRLQAEPAPSPEIAPPSPEKSAQTPGSPPEPARRLPASPASLAPRAAAIMDPGTMAPDDPGPEEPAAERGDFRLYASE